MRLYNTLGREVQEFKPIEAGKVKLYTCGPTVYDYAHIGNLRSFVFDDTLRRALQSNFEVKHVMNITDVGHLAGDLDDGEDKLEKGAAREDKTVEEVAAFYTGAFEKDMKALNVLPPNGYDGPHAPYALATDFIKQQLDMIKLLLQRGFAYQTEQAIYFDVSKLSDYGKLTGQKLSDKETAARSEVIVDKAKKHPQDFAVWFFKVGRFKDHSMSWPSPWGDGFPGWHIECSAIIHATLVEPIDIHTGGVDHIGTHHTNEIAQTEAAFDVKLANYWLHNEHLLVNNQRMAKSAQNFVTLDEVVKKAFNPLALRLLFLQAHYRSQMNFTWEALKAAEVNLKELWAWADLVYQPRLLPEADSQKLLAGLQNTLADDLNSAKALALINEQVAKAAPPRQLLEDLDKLLGLDFSKRQDINDEQKKLIAEREQARKGSDFAKADQIRKDLGVQGLELNDTPKGPIWSRV